jgi:taurine dioxygenase
MGDRPDPADGNRLTAAIDYTITPPFAHTGAEVRCIDLSCPVGDADRTRLYRAFVEHSVLVLRDQQLTPHQLLSP